MTLDLDRLETIAKAATRGPWTWASHQTADGDHWAVFDTSDTALASNNDGWAPDAEFIAAFAPRTVLDLIAWLKKAEATIARVEDLAAHWQETGNGHYRDLDKALEGDTP